jgi:hypothetical protein
LAVDEVDLNGEWKSKSPLKVAKFFRGKNFAKAPDPPKRPILKLEKTYDETSTFTFFFMGESKSGNIG